MVKQVRRVAVRRAQAGKHRARAEWSGPPQLYRSEPACGHTYAKKCAANPLGIFAAARQALDVLTPTAHRAMRRPPSVLSA